jgi:ribonuclease Z
MAFSITILGSSAATPTSRRNPSSILVNMDYTYFLMDCGEGTQIQMRKSKIKLQRIRHIFISHLHGDHFFGLVGLISTFHLLGRTEELHVYAPRGLQDIIQLQLMASQTQLIYPLIFHDTNPDQPEILYETDEHLVKSFPLDHRIETTGFLFAEKQKPRKLKKSFLFYDVEITVEDILKIKAGADFVSDTGRIFKNADITEDPPQPLSFAYCSDTRYFEPVIQYINKVNLLYHEATFMEDMKSVAQEKYHSTALEAATIAKKANAGMLILGHFSARYKELDQLLAEAQSIFKNTQLATDGLTIDLGTNEKTR